MRKDVSELGIEEFMSSMPDTGVRQKAAFKRFLRALLGEEHPPGRKRSEEGRPSKAANGLRFDQCMLGMSFSFIKTPSLSASWTSMSDLVSKISIFKDASKLPRC